MNDEIRLIEIEDNKSENDNIIMPTGNCLFSNKYKSYNHIYHFNNNNKSKICIKDLKKLNNSKNQNIFSNIILKEYFLDNNNKRNNHMKSTLIHKDKNITLLRSSKSITNIIQLKCIFL